MATFPNSMPRDVQAQARALAARAGIEAHELRYDPVHGLLMSATAVRKLAALVPDTAQKMTVLEAVTRAEADSLGSAGR